MSLVKPRKLKGFRDCMGREMTLRSKICQILADIATSFNFESIDTPALEYRQVLLGEGGETDKQVYGFEDLGGRQVVLRYDLTVPLARLAAEYYGRYSLPLRRFQMGKVWRAEKPQKGRYREFMQGDFDVIGIDEPAAKMEVLAMVSTCLEQVPSVRFVMALGHRQVLSWLCHEYFNVCEQAEKAVFMVLDKLAKVGQEAVNVMLEEKLRSFDIDPTGIESFTQMVSDSDMTQLKQKLEQSSQGQKSTQAREALAELEGYVSWLSEQFAGSQIRFVIDVSLARGLEYYTGMVFETTVEDSTRQETDYGSICSGGCYDHLVSRFSNHNLSGVGASVGIDRLVSVLTEVLPVSHVFGQPEQPIIFLVCDLKAEGAMEWMMSVAIFLRQSGFKVSHVLATKSIQKQYQQAARCRAQWAVFLENQDGDRDHIWNHHVSIKDLSTRQQTSGVLADLRDLMTNKRDKQE